MKNHLSRKCGLLIDTARAEPLPSPRTVLSDEEYERLEGLADRAAIAANDIAANLEEEP